jgi:dTDP-4-dehydrorhamnose reductase
LATWTVRSMRTHVDIRRESRHRRMITSTSLLVFGGQGQLALEIGALRCWRLPRALVDITDGAALARRISEYRPAVVANVAAYTKVDDAEMDSAGAFRVNGTGAQLVAEACAIGRARSFISRTICFSTAPSRPPIARTTRSALPMWMADQGCRRDGRSNPLRSSHHPADLLAVRHLLPQFLKRVLQLAGERDELRFRPMQRLSERYSRLGPRSLCRRLASGGGR